MITGLDSTTSKAASIVHIPDGTPKQKRWYDNEGNAERDRDYNHAGDFPFPHDHEWEDGERNPDHLPPSPEYAFSGNVLIGTGLVVISVIGIAYVIANDITGIGISDDALAIPLAEGIIMIFK